MKKTLVSALTTALVVGAASTTFAAANPFADVPADHWAYDSVAQLHDAGVIEGYTSGDYMGNSTMTRYEMAQIVAKAMTKLESADDANKARIDKLAAEFSDELANLGVRVAALENKVDNVKWAGWMRYEYKYSSNSNGQGETDAAVNGQKMHLRMNVSMKINDNWTAYSRLKSTHDMNSNSSTDADGHTTTSFDRGWVQGDYDNFTVKLGKFQPTPGATHGMLVDYCMSGAEVQFGKVVKTSLFAGRTNPDGFNRGTKADYDSDLVNGKVKTTVLGVDVRYVGEKLDLGATYLQYRNLENTNFIGLENGKDNVGVWGVGAGWKFDDKWYLSGEYAHANNVVDMDKKNARVQVQYGQMDAQQPGTWDLKLQYRKRGGVATFGDQGDWAASQHDKGWALIGEFALKKNIIAELAYYQGKNYRTDEKNKAFWGQLQFIF